MDRMNAVVVAALVLIVSLSAGSYFLRDSLNPMALHNAPGYPPPEYGMPHGWNASTGVFANTNTCVSTNPLSLGSTCTMSLVFSPVDKESPRIAQK